MKSILQPEISSLEIPPVAALFVVAFDQRAGYVIRWQESIEGVNLDGVEFKSLPSGLHALKEDLVYFVHPPYAGLSAFMNVPAPSSQRGAHLFSIGLLVPLSYGRLGRCWHHAEALKELGRQYAQDPNNTDPLRNYYNQHKLAPDSQPPPLSPLLDAPSALRYRPSGSQNRLRSPDSLRIRRRTTSDVTSATDLSPHHPARSLGEFIDVLGPLLFPLYRAALCRKRILIITTAPVERACKFVYDISVISNIPSAVHETLRESPKRLKPLFVVGVNDIPFLEGERDGEGWVACTTDHVLKLKAQLYDVVVTLPSASTRNAANGNGHPGSVKMKRVWPTLETPDGVAIKATQRDLKRWRKLRDYLSPSITIPTDGVASDNDDSDEDEDEDNAKPESLCHPPTWREIAYESFVWWASAGERSSSSPSSDEDAFLLPPLSSAKIEVEVEVMAYFHRLTARIFEVFAEVVEEEEREAETEDGRLVRAGEEGELVVVGVDDMRRVGLNEDDEDDRGFVRMMMWRFWGRSEEEVVLEQGGWEICGVRCC
ncbi:hypothetical protein RUND412_005192 [Rhizina undulata]